MFISLDLETTGINPGKDKIIEFGAVKFDLNGQIETYQTLINPGVPLPQIITHITGLTDKDLAEAPSFEEKKEEILKFMGDLPIVGHNIQFDIDFLRAQNLEIKNLQYDTLQLSSILFPSLPSYSLEILSNILSLKHEEKHRALDDSIAAMELFIKLADKFKELDPDLIKQIHELLKKSSWHLKHFLLELEAKTQPLHPFNPKGRVREAEAITHEFDLKGRSPYKEILAAKKSTLFEIQPSYSNLVLDLAAHANKETVIALPNYFFQEINEEIPDTVAKIDSLGNYISLKRLENFMKKESFLDHEITSVIKYLIWSKETSTGLLSKITLQGKEKSTLSRINVDKDFVDITQEPFIQKALKKDKNSPAIISHQYLIEEKPIIKNLILISLENFTKTIHYNSSAYLSLVNFIKPLEELREISQEKEAIDLCLSKSTILFGLMGIFYEKYSDNDFYSPKSQITHDHLQFKEWKEIQKTIINLIENSHGLKIIKNSESEPILKKWKINLTDLHNIFFNPDFENEIIWFEKDYNGEIIIRKIPTSITEKLKEILLNCGKYMIIDENIDLNDDGEFLKNLFDLEKDLPIQKIEKPQPLLDIEIAKNCPERDPDNKNTVAKFLIKTLKDTSTPSAIICNSKEQIMFFTLALSKEFKKVGKQIISQTLGSIGKVSEKFKQDPTNSIILLTPALWQHFDSPEMIKTLILHKIPFDSPSNPYLITLSRKYINPFDQFQIPHALFNLKKTLNRLGESKVIILDSRIITKNYSNKFLENLAKRGKIETITID